MKQFKLCRICTKKINDEKSLKLFEKTHNWISKIEEITGILLENSKPLPQYICKLCQGDLEIACEFKERCINAQEYFNSVDFIGNKSSAEDLEIKSELPPSHEEYNNEFVAISVEADIEIKDELPIEEKDLDEICFVKTEQNDVFQLADGRDESNDDSKSSCDISNDSDNSEGDTDALNLNETNRKQVSAASSKDLQSETQPRVKRQYRKRIKSPNTQLKKIEEKLKEVTRRKLRTENDSKTFICDQCGSYFNCKSNFLTHQRRHTGDKEYHCEICPEQFFLHSELKRHVRKHTGERPFPCRYCERRFIDYSTRFKHERTHTNERPFACTQCSKAFTNSYILKNHMLSHTGERSFRCDMCDKSFGRKTHLVTHYRSMQHKQNLEKMQQGTATLPSENIMWEQTADVALQHNYKD